MASWEYPFLTFQQGRKQGTTLSIQFPIFQENMIWNTTFQLKNVFQSLTGHLGQAPGGNSEEDVSLDRI